MSQWIVERDCGYEEEEARLTKRYWKAVGWCLQYKIPIQRDGVMKALGELEEEIAAYEGHPSSWDFVREVMKVRDHYDERA